MTRSMKSVLAACSLSVCIASVVTIASCVQSVDLKLPALNGGATVSEGRTNAARMLVQGTTFLVDLVQFTGAGTQDPCYPFGGPGHAPWKSRLAAPVVVTSDFKKSEYDLLAKSASGETDYVLSVRVAYPRSDPHFTQVEFNFRAVSPFETNHVAGGSQPHYLVDEAVYTSNDVTPADRSLIDLAGGDYAILVVGLEFEGLAGHCEPSTKAYMNGLGTTGWVAFMRDNAHLSGRFYAIRGAMTGAPRALTDTPPPSDDADFLSVQVRGDQFDALSTNPTLLSDPPPIEICPQAGDHYAILDLSNRDETLGPEPGRGGFAFVMRNTGFANNNKVVVNPSANPGNPPAAGNKISAPLSGYDEPALHAAGLVNHPGASDHSLTGPQGVHEIAISVFFIHTWDECLEELTAEYVCTDVTPQGPRDRWVIHNPNSIDVLVNWEVVLPAQSGGLTATPGDTYFWTDSAMGPGSSLSIMWDWGAGLMSAAAAWGPAVVWCGNPYEPLTVEYLCTEEGGVQFTYSNYWTIHNPHAYPVDIEWEVVSAGDPLSPRTGNLTVPPGDTVLETETHSSLPPSEITITWDWGATTWNASASWVVMEWCPEAP